MKLVEQITAVAIGVLFTLALGAMYRSIESLATRLDNYRAETGIQIVEIRDEMQRRTDKVYAVPALIERMSQLERDIAVLTQQVASLEQRVVAQLDRIEALLLSNMQAVQRSIEALIEATREEGAR